MNIVVKPDTKNIKNYINAGINAFILCLENFSSCTKITWKLSEIKKLTKEYKDIDFYIEIDKNIFNKDLEKLRKYLLEIDELRISGIFFYDLSLINLKTKLNLKTDLIYSPNFLVTNYKTCNYYEEMGIKGILISPCITKDEIKEIIEKTNINKFINVFGYQVMSFSKRHLVTNYFNEIKKDKKYKYIKKEGRKFEIIENETGTYILSDTILNGMKYLNYFKDSNIILNEISINHNKFLKVIKKYIESIKENKDLTKDIEKIIPNTSLQFFDKETIVRVKK